LGTGHGANHTKVAFAQKFAKHHHSLTWVERGVYAVDLQQTAVNAALGIDVFHRQLDHQLLGFAIPGQRAGQDADVANFHGRFVLREGPLGQHGSGHQGQ